jgi:hypothetical protein
VRILLIVEVSSAKLLRTGDTRKSACSQRDRAGTECVRGYNTRFSHGDNPRLVTHPYCRRPHHLRFLTLRSVVSLKLPIVEGLGRCFSDTQPWVRTDLRLNFLDQTAELEILYEQEMRDVFTPVSRKASKQPQLLHLKGQESISPRSIPGVSEQTSAHISISISTYMPAGPTDTQPPRVQRPFATTESDIRESVSQVEEQTPTSSAYGPYLYSYPGSYFDISPGGLSHS